MNKDKNYYTAGEIAAISGISARTIRFYDKKGLLKPSGYSKSGQQKLLMQKRRPAPEIFSPGHPGGLSL